MTNQDIETFFAVLDHGTMTAAAEALFITQPSLSARLRALEDEVGAPLFHRGKGLRRITLTDAGQHFLPLARRWQNLLAETQTFAAAEKREFLHVIAAYTANQYILPPVYQRFLERELPVNLWVESMRTDQAVSAVARGDADMAIVDGGLHYDLQIEAKPLFREGFFLVVPKTVALTEPVEATTLHVQDEILIYGQPEILQWHDYWCGVDARPLLYADTPQLAETLPACGKRWSIIPAGATGPYLRMFSNVQVLHLAHPPAERTFYLVTPKGRALSAAAETLLDDLRTQIQHVEGITGIDGADSTDRDASVPPDRHITRTKRRKAMAQLYFKYGAMGSSKTANALMARFNYEERGQETLLVKPRLDTRDGDHMVYSRIGLKHPCIYFDEMRAMPEDELKKYACIIIDEAQFLTKEEVYYLVHLVDDCGIPVICYGLRADFKGDLFPGSYHLLVLADKLEEVKTICWCGKKAAFNARFDENGHVVKEGAQVVLGANDKYIGLCRRHWMAGDLGPDFDIHKV